MMLTSLMVMSNKEVNDHWNVPCYNHSRVSHSCLASHLLTMDIIIIINGGGNDDGDDGEYRDAAGDDDDDDDDRVVNDGNFLAILSGHENGPTACSAGNTLQEFKIPQFLRLSKKYKFSTY